MLLTTYRKDGTAVPTPVWAVRDGAELRVWTNVASGKYKRIRRNPAVTVAPCSSRGVPRGEPVAATARLLPDAEVPALLTAIYRKYGIGGHLAVLSSLIRNRVARSGHGGGTALVLD